MQSQSYLALHGPTVLFSNSSKVSGLTQRSLGLFLNSFLYTVGERDLVSIFLRWILASPASFIKEAVISLMHVLTPLLGMGWIWLCRVIFPLGLLFHWSLSVCFYVSTMPLWLCSTVWSHEFINLTKDGPLLKTLKHGRRAIENTRQKDFLCSKIICLNGRITKGNMQSR